MSSPFGDVGVAKYVICAIFPYVDLLVRRVYPSAYEYSFSAQSRDFTE